MDWKRLDVYSHFSDDHTRVHLLPLPGQKKSTEYLNANYIDGFQRSRAYIGTQGPLPATFNCFWRMVWEQRVGIIVMITNLIERGRVSGTLPSSCRTRTCSILISKLLLQRKCDMYWPKEGTEVYGVISVTMVREDVMATYTIRTFQIRHLRVSRSDLNEIIKVHVRQSFNTCFVPIRLRRRKAMFRREQCSSITTPIGPIMGHRTIRSQFCDSWANRRQPIRPMRVQS